jgi:hypothetical protein
VRKAVAALVVVASLAVACGDPAPTSPGSAGASGGGAAGTCPVGTADCNDTPDTPMGSDSGMAMCVEGVEDCDDMVVSGPGGSSSDERRPQRVKPQPGMTDLHKVGWEDANARGNRKVVVEFWSGVEPCYVLDHVDVEYRDDEVEITLWEGGDPAEPDTACIEIAVLKSTKVKLSEPLGDRTIVDGAE